jgi:hypothetical protein
MLILLFAEPRLIITIYLFDDGPSPVCRLYGDCEDLGDTLHNISGKMAVLGRVPALYPHHATRDHVTDIRANRRTTILSYSRDDGIGGGENMTEL